MESDEVSISLNLSYINDIGESEAIEEAIADSVGNDIVPGGAASVQATFGGMTVIAEYLTATPAAPPDPNLARLKRPKLDIPQRSPEAC